MNARAMISLHLSRLHRAEADEQTKRDLVAQALAEHDQKLDALRAEIDEAKRKSDEWRCSDFSGIPARNN